MPILFDKKDLNVPRPDPPSVIDKLIGESLIEIIAIGVFVFAVYKILRALKIF